MDIKYKKDIAKRIKQLRKEYDLTQEALAKRLGLGNKSSIANYESGKMAPCDSIKIDLCKLFNCSMDYLMGLSEIRLPSQKYQKLETQLKSAEMVYKHFHKANQSEIKWLQRQIDIKDNYCNMIWCLGVDYDGYETPEGLKSLIDELVNLAKKAEINDDKYAMYEGCGNKFYNILHEEVTAPKEEYLKDEEN